MRTRSGVSLFLAFLLALATLAAPAAHAALISEQQEIQIGRQAAAEIEAEFGVVHDPVQQRRIDAIGARLVRLSDRPRLPWTFRILDVGEVNAVSLPGGFVYVTRGMLGFVRNDHELAFVLAHEIAHANQRHHVQLLERSFALAIVAAVLTGGNPDAAAIAGFVRFLLTRGFSREFEFEADQVGVRLMHRAGFRASHALWFLIYLQRSEGREPSRFEVLFRTHPALGDRIVRVREELRRLGYRV
jgi:predicted Zn-dependent protease